MKKWAIVSVLFVLGLVVAASALAADQAAIKKQVDDIVVAIDGGKKAEDFAAEAKKDPYVFIMEAGGKLLVHPSLVGQNLKEKADVVYNEVSKGTAEGLWVKYEWQGKKKNTYTRKTKSGLIVGCGYNE